MNSKIEKLVSVIKHTGLSLDNYTQAELAHLAGLSMRTIIRQYEEIEAYCKVCTDQPTTAEIQHFKNRSLDHYIELASKTKHKQPYRVILGAIVGHTLKYEYGILSAVRKPSTLIKYGTAIVSLYSQITSRKDRKKGTPIHSGSKAVNELLHHNKWAYIDKLFTKSTGYYSGNKAKVWNTTTTLTSVVDRSVSILLDIIDNTECHIKWETYSSICSPVNVTFPNTNLFEVEASINKAVSIEVRVGDLRQLSTNSTLQVLQHSLGYVNDTKCLILPIQHLSNTNELLGRSYNIFCRLRSKERLLLGYTGYDMAAGLQTISLQLIGATADRYPLLTRYTNDTQYKREIRQLLATDLGISIDQVKQKLTAFANGSVSGSDKHSLYKQFQEESDLLRREVLAYTTKHNPKILQQAIQQSKKDLPEDIDWFSATAEDKQSLARGKSSVFFFVWTWYERQIRQSMLKVIPEGIEVHDAVYSKDSTISTKLIEQQIEKDTGFKVRIEKE